MSEDQVKVIIEHFDDKFSAFLENVETIVDKKVRSIVREELTSELDPIKTDIKVIKAAVTDTNKGVKDHEIRLTRLEQKAA